MAKYVHAISKDLDKLRTRSDEIQVLYLIDGNYSVPNALLSLIKQLKDTLHDNPNIIALAAPQLGEFSRVFCVRFANGDIRTFINPMTTKSEGLHLNRESNPSLPGREFIVPRHSKIRVVFQTPMGRPEDNVFEGHAAAIVQQMMQQLDGILLSDIGLEVFDDFDKATPEQQQEVIKLYIDSLNTFTDQVNQEIENNPELKEMQDAIKFMTKVSTGEIVLEDQVIDKPEEVKEDPKDE